MVNKILNEGEKLYFVTIETVESWTRKDAKVETTERFYAAKDFPSLLRKLADTLPLVVKFIKFELAGWSVERID